MTGTPLIQSPASVVQPDDTSPDATTHIVVADMFDGTVEQFEDTFGGEPGGLTLAGFLDLALRWGQPIRIDITPPSAS